MVNQLGDNLNLIAFYPALRTEEINDTITDADFKIISEEGNLSSSEKKVFKDFKDHINILKSSFHESYLREKIQYYSKDDDEKNNKIYSNKKKISSIKEKILANLNKIYFKENISKEENIIKAVSSASEKIPCFLQKVSSHMSGLSQDKVLINKTSLKGLMFDWAL